METNAYHVHEVLSRTFVRYATLELNGEGHLTPRYERVIIIDPRVEVALRTWSYLVDDVSKLPVPNVPAGYAAWSMVDCEYPRGESGTYVGVISSVLGHTLMRYAPTGIEFKDMLMPRDFTRWSPDLTIDQIAFCAALANYAQLGIRDPNSRLFVDPKTMAKAWGTVRHALNVGKKDLGPCCRAVCLVGYSDQLLMEAMNVETAVKLPPKPVPVRRRLAVIGGDDRLHRQEWPDIFDVSTYSADDHAKLLGANRQMPFDTVIILARWISHASYKALHSACDNLFVWNHGIPRLAKELPTLLERPVPAVSALPGVTRGDVDTAAITWSRGILETLVAFEDKEWTAEEIADFLDVPLSDYAAVLGVIECMAGRGQLVFAQTAPVPKYKALPAPPAPPEPAPTPAPTETPMPEEKPVQKPMRHNMALMPDAPFAVSVGQSTIECDSLAEALEMITEYGDKATLWKRMKVRLKAELDE
jgi:hypothetical protein